MSDGPGCPQCGTTVEPHWDWCHACGFDPEGLMPPELRAASRVPSTVAAYGAPSPAIGPAPTAAPYPGPVGRPGAIPPPGPVWDMTPVPTKRRSGGTIPSLLIILGGLAVVAVIAVALLGHTLLQAAVSSKSGAGASDPVSYSAPDASFSASFSGPATPADSMSLDNIPEHDLAWHGNGNVQLVRWAALQPDYNPADEEQALDYTTRSMTTTKGTSTKVTFEGHSARRFTMTLDGRDVEGMVFIANGRTWTIQLIGPWASKDPQATDFFNSLKLAPPG